MFQTILTSMVSYPHELIMFGSRPHTLSRPHGLKYSASQILGYLTEICSFSLLSSLLCSQTILQLNGHLVFYQFYVSLQVVVLFDDLIGLSYTLVYILIRVIMLPFFSNYYLSCYSHQETHTYIYLLYLDVAYQASLSWHSLISYVEYHVLYEPHLFSHGIHPMSYI